MEERKRVLRAKATLELAKLLGTTLAKANVRPEQAPIWKMHVRHGPPSVVVEKATSTMGTDLLVLGTRGHSGAAAYLFLGTVAGDLLRSAKCDVLIVPPSRRA
jgi:nucleotide-binding universal stress UspA family protein